MVIIHNSMIWDMVWSGVSWDMTLNHHSPVLKKTCFSMPSEIIISLSLNDIKVGHTLLLTRANATSASPLKRWGLVVYLNQKRANVRKKRETTNLPHLELERHNDKDFAQKCRLLKQRLWVCFLQQNSSLLICIFFFSRKAIYYQWKNIQIGLWKLCTIACGYFFPIQRSFPSIYPNPSFS